MPVPSTSRSTGSAARSRPIRQLLFICKPSVVQVILSTSTRRFERMTTVADRRLDRAKRRSLLWHVNRFLERHLPDRLYPRSLIIVVAPMVILQAIMAFIIMERHW